MAADVPDTRVSGDERRPSATTEAEAAAALGCLPRSERYMVTSALAEGGMGEVLKAQDIPLAREVVIKRMRSATPSPESITRFLREARIQGRLQHPSIVPVHDLAVDATGRPFFAMKALPRTATLADILEGNRNHDSSGNLMSRAQLLRVFVDVCFAVAYAHNENVLHRDLKPANIAVGKFNEVYVLDWGVARILDADHPDTLDGLFRHPADAAPPRIALDAPSDDWPLADEVPPTRPGSILGTPGYMSPEQLRADPTIGPASDVYALGCILFEMLAGEPLHPRTGPMASTAMGADARASRRIPDVSLELDAICVRATALLPADRFADAGALGDAVQRYLDGDRDVARRRELAHQHIRDARDALASGDDDGRRDAVRLASAALSLDPESADAARMLGHLVVTAPTKMPDELRRELDAKLFRENRQHAQLALYGVAAYYLFLPIFLWIGIRDWTWLLSTYALVTLTSAFTITSVMMPHPAAWRAWVSMFLNATITASFARLIGPFVVAPGLASVSIAVFSTNPYLARHGKVVLATFIAAALAPWGLEALGVLAPSYITTDTGFLLFSAPLAINPGPGQIAVVGYIIAVLVVMSALTFRAARASQAIRTQLELQAWHLRQLMPSDRSSRPSMR